MNIIKCNIILKSEKEKRQFNKINVKLQFILFNAIQMQDILYLPNFTTYTGFKTIAFKEQGISNKTFLD